MPNAYQNSWYDLIAAIMLLSKMPFCRLCEVLALLYGFASKTCDAPCLATYHPQAHKSPEWKTIAGMSARKLKKDIQELQQNITIETPEMLFYRKAVARSAVALRKSLLDFQHERFTPKVWRGLFGHRTSKHNQWFKIIFVLFFFFWNTHEARFCDFFNVALRFRFENTEELKAFLRAEIASRLRTYNHATEAFVNFGIQIYTFLNKRQLRKNVKEETKAFFDSMPTFVNCFLTSEHFLPYSYFVLVQCGKWAVKYKTVQPTFNEVEAGQL